MTPHDFLKKWRNVELKERSASQSHFNDLTCTCGACHKSGSNQVSLCRFKQPLDHVAPYRLAIDHNLKLLPVTQIHNPHDWLARGIVCQLNMAPGTPVKSLAFAAKEKAIYVDAVSCV
jgi:hypothetical protein